MPHPADVEGESVSWYAKVEDQPVDVRNDQMRRIDDRSRAAMVPGERTEVRVPFEGESDLFYNRPSRSTMNPPRALIEGNELVLSYQSPADAPLDVRSLIDRALADIEQYLHGKRERSTRITPTCL